LKVPTVSTRDGLLAVLLALAFALAGWKIFTRPPAADFAGDVVPPVPTAAAPALPAASTAAVQPPPAAGAAPRFDTGFVSSEPGQAVHAASIIELANGGLRAVWFSGSREGASDVAIKTAVFDPATLKWGAESALFTREPLERGLWRYVKKIGNPVIARAPDGSLRLWMVTVSLGGWAGSSISWSRSNDEGASWSAPRRLVTSPFLNISTLVKGAPFAFADGRTGLPVYHEFIAKFAEVLRLDADGRVVDKQRIPGSQTSLQPVVLVHGPSDASVFMRSGTAEALMASRSTDGGRHWLASEATAWPNPDSALAGVVAQDGASWLALNPASRGRETLALLRLAPGADIGSARLLPLESAGRAVSPMPVADYEKRLGDELLASGATPADVKAYVASARRQLCGPATCSLEFSYPYMLRTRDGYLHLVYTWQRSRIKHLRLDPAGLSSNATVN
jgi:predicted neuraminidase